MSNQQGFLSSAARVLLWSAAFACGPVEVARAQAEACCLPDGSCTDQPREDCIAAGGHPRGSGTDCATIDPACEPFEACCFEYFCDDRSPTDCLGSYGLPQGAGTDCATTGCPDQACCLPDGSCTDQPRADCTAAGGQARGLGTDCATIDPACEPFEACCFEFFCADRDSDIPKHFRGDAAFAIPALYRVLEEEGFQYTIRIPSNGVLMASISHLLTCPVGRPSGAC